MPPYPILLNTHTPPHLYLNRWVFLLTACTEKNNQMAQLEKKCFCFRGSIKLFIIPAGMGKELARHRGAQDECWASVWCVGGAFRNHFQVLLLPNILPDSPRTQRLPFPGSPIIYQAAFQLANSLGTVSHSYQAMLGTFLTSKFPDTGQGPALLIDLLKYHSGCELWC